MFLNKIKTESVTSVFYIFNKVKFSLILYFFNIIRLSLTYFNKDICIYLNDFFYIHIFFLLNSLI